MESPGFLIRNPKSQTGRRAWSNFGSRLSVFRCRIRAFSKFPFVVHRGCVKYIGALSDEGGFGMFASMGFAQKMCREPLCPSLRHIFCAKPLQWLVGTR